MAYRTNSLGALKLTAVQTANYSANPYDLVACDVSGGAFAVTLPTAPADQTVVGVVLVTSATSPGATAATTILTVATGGSDVFSKAGGGTTASIVLTNQQETYVYNASGGIWTNGLGRLPRASIPPNKTVAPTATYTAIAGDIVLATAGAGGFTVTLPAVTKNAQVLVKKVDSGAGTITVSPASGTIDGAASLALVVQYDLCLLVANGTNWLNLTAIVGNVNIESIIRANSLNQLAPATGNYAMGGNTLTGVAVAAATGQPLIYDQLPTGDAAGTISVTGTDPPVIASTGVFKSTTATDGAVVDVVKLGGTTGEAWSAVYANSSDANPIVAIGNPFALTLGAPCILMGSGGASTPDTLLIRSGAGSFKITNNVAVGGKSGATAANSWVGATTGGAPASGTFSTGDWITTTTGQVLICTAGGSPGTWTRANQKSLVTNAPGATPSINVDTTDIATFTGLAAAITSMTTNLTGTPVEGQKLIVKFTDNGTARAITWGAKFASTTISLPTTTVISTLLHVGFIYDNASTTWKCVGVA